MGEIAEATLAGLYCEGCGEVFPDMDEPGYPRRCASCRPKGRKPVPATKRAPLPPLRAKDRKWLEKVREWTDFQAGMYRGLPIDLMPEGPRSRLLARRSIVQEQPHNPVHKVRLVITDAGLAELERAS